jgi:hypothetical protein
MAVLARDDLAVSKWADLNQRSVRIAVPQASSMDKYLTENVPKATIQRFRDLLQERPSPEMVRRVLSWFWA